MPPDAELLFAGLGVDDLDLGHLPLGATADPVKRMVLNADWPSVGEALVVENAVHSDFDPRDAPR